MKLSVVYEIDGFCKLATVKVTLLGIDVVLLKPLETVITRVVELRVHVRFEESNPFTPTHLTEDGRVT